MPIPDNTAGALHVAIAAVCPIHGVSIGRADDKSTWRIDYDPEATTEQRSAAETVKQTIDIRQKLDDARNSQQQKAAKREALLSMLEEVDLDRLTNLLNRKE